MEINPYLLDIVKSVRENPVVSVVAPTGSGKSLGIPKAAVEDGMKILVSVPTITAATTLASYQRKLSPNAVVGYAAEGVVHYDRKAQIIYATSGHLRRKLLSHFKTGNKIDFVDCLMVDEAHSGTLDNTVNVGLWNYARKKKIFVPSLIVSTATPNGIPIEPTPAEIEIKVRSYPISIHYHNKDFDFSDQEKLYHETAKVVCDVLSGRYGETNGDILVFAPGSSEVETIFDNLAKAELENVVLFKAFGAMPGEELSKIYEPLPAGQRKIVIGTNVVESAVTIENLGVVVDTLIEKQAGTSITGGFRLEPSMVSKDSAKQRAGRTGRTRPGLVIRMITERSFELLQDHRLPEVQRIPIHNVVMELLDAGLDPEEILNVGDGGEKVKKSIELLLSLGMIVRELSGIKVTRMGNFAPKVPLGVRNAAVLWKWLQVGLPAFPGIVATSLIDCFGPNYFFYPRREQKETPREYSMRMSVHKDMHFGPYRGDGDVETYLNMWSELMTSVGGMNGSYRDVKNWCMENSINNKKIRELLLIVGQCCNTVVSDGYECKQGRFTTEGVVEKLYPILAVAYKDLILEENNEGPGYVNKDGAVHLLDNRQSVNNIAMINPKYVIALLSAEIKTVRGVIRYISLAVPLREKPKELSPSAAVFVAKVPEQKGNPWLTPRSTPSASKTATPADSPVRAKRPSIIPIRR